MNVSDLSFRQNEWQLNDYLDVIDYRDDTVLVNYVGACGTCPSSAAGTLSAIESTLRSEINPDIRVVAASGQY